MVPLGGVAMLLCVASAAYACTAFNGSFTVVGSGGGSVTSDGTDAQDVPGMSQTISGSTSAPPANGTITISTGLAVNGTKLPQSNGPHHIPNRNVGAYDINYFDGPAYADDEWVVDCMSYSVENIPPEGGYHKLGTVTVDGSGVAQGSAAARTFALPTSKPTTLPGTTDAAVCISDATGFWGNQVPISIV